jgi:hypothetical protein
LRQNKVLRHSANCKFSKFDSGLDEKDFSARFLRFRKNLEIHFFDLLERSYTPCTPHFDELDY